MNVKLRINDREVRAREGTMLLEAAESAGFTIPAMCRNTQVEHFTSCMVCLVKERSSGVLMPSCSVRVVPGMDIVTSDDEIDEARKTALELLLSEHVGDCEAPCRLACPAFMDIPLMNRLIASGMHAQALEIVRRDIALPAVLGRICPAPCEGACKRKPIDEPVAVCLLKRFSADQAGENLPIETASPNGKKVAVIGAGPAGLAAAFYLQRQGIQAVVIDRNELPGGNMQYTIADDTLDKAVLGNEISHIRRMGVQFRQNQHVDAAGFEKLRTGYDAVVVASGDYGPAMADWGLENNGRQVLVDKSTYLTNLDRVFAIGNVNRSMQLAIRSAAQGKEVAGIIGRMLQGEAVSGEKRRFNSSFGKLHENEYAEYLKEGSAAQRQQPEGVAGGEPDGGTGVLSGGGIGGGIGGGLSPEQAQTEAGRCMHCDCRKPDDCKLRDYADLYGASKKRFSYSERKPIVKHVQQHGLVYEPGKCIKCGICVRLTAKHRETFGFTFIGRGFDVVIGVPFNETLDKALEKTAETLAAACPTGALALKTNPDARG